LLPEEAQGRVRGHQQARTQRTDALNGTSGNQGQTPLVESQDGFAAARWRWQQRRKRLLEAEGGAISTEQAARTLNTTPDVIEKRRQEGILLGLRGDGDGYVYPVWQFDHEKPIRGLSAVLQELQGVGPWMRAAFMLTGDAHLGGERPLDVLRRGETEAVVAAAREYGEQGGG
jgi:hypothetical protein